MTKTNKECGDYEIQTLGEILDELGIEEDKEFKSEEEVRLWAAQKRRERGPKGRALPS